jgi:DNA-binding LacI/PurR family transcriptional regulator
MKAADELGYRPNAIARMLITRRTNLFAVIVANLDSNPEFAAAISREMARRGLNVLFYTLDHETDADRAIEQLLQYRVDGVISAAALSNRHVGMLTDRSLPFVFLNRFYDDIPVNAVCCDQAEGERWLVDRLIANGHERFAIITGPADSVISRQRVQAAADRLAANGLARPLLEHSDFTYHGGREAMRRLATGQLPDAVICANDMIALGCMDEARHSLGISIPDEMSVVGFDGSTAGRWSSYDLTTVRQPVTAMVVAAIDMLVARVGQPAQANEKRTFSGELIPGSSSRLA